MDKAINMTVTLKVTGDEEFTATFEYKNTNMKTVLMVEQAVLNSFGGLLNTQANNG